MHLPPLHRRRAVRIGLLLHFLAMAIVLMVSAGHVAAKTPAEWANSAAEKIRQKDYDGALEDLNLAIRSNPHSAMLYTQRGTLNLMRKSPDTFNDYDSALAIDPSYVPALLWRGAAKSQAGAQAAAIADYNEAIRLKPDSAAAFAWRGQAKGNSGDLPGAVADLNSAILLDPKNQNFIFWRASIQDYLGNYHDAVADYGQVLGLNPTDVPALNNLAWDYAAAPGLEASERAKALAPAIKACELTNWKNSSHLDTLAAAYAAVGKYEDAIKWQRACITLLSSGDHDTSDAETRLKLYQKHQPYVIPPRKS